MFIAVLLIGTKKRKQPKCLLIDEWIIKCGYIYIMYPFPAIDRNEVLMLQHG